MPSLIFAITHSNSKTQVEDDLQLGRFFFRKLSESVQRFSELPIISANNRGR